MNGICQRRAAVRRRRDRTGSLLRSGICVGACCLVGAAALLAGCPSSGPVGKATVYTDVHGVPHVYGETEYDVMFGLGYAMARDQLDTIVTLYRVASGRLSAKEGPGDEFSNVVSDYLTHLFLVPESAAAAYAAIPENERAWLDGFADGLNAYIREYNLTHTPNIEYFSGRDVAAWGVYIAFGRQISDALTELQQEVEIDLKVRPKIMFDSERAASNQWAVSQTRTGGSVMVYGDPHLLWRGPAQWYEAHLKMTTGGLNVTGAAVLGTPLIAVGRNEHVAWSLTSNTPALDYADVYKEKLARPYGLSEYVYEPDPRGVKPIVTRMLALEVDTIPVPLWVPMYYTHHGPILPLGVEGIAPVITRDGEHVYSVAVGTMDGTLNQYPGMHVAGMLRLFYRLDRAESVRDVKLALGLQGEADSYPPSEALQLFKWNVVAGDTGGDVYYVHNGRCPVRVAPHFENPGFYGRPVAGWTGENEWVRDDTGHVVHWAIADLPQVMNPACGYLINCNSAPWYVCPGNGIDPSAYPPYLVRNVNTERTARARDLIEAVPTVTEADMRRFGLDVHIIAADVFETLLFSFFDAGAYPDLVDAVELLASEPNEATRDNRSVLLLHQWFSALGAAFYLYPADPAEMTQPQRDLLIATLRQARDELTACPCGIAPVWSEIHHIQQGATWPVGGGTGPIATLFQTFGDYAGCPPIQAESGSSFMQVTVLTPGNVTSRSARPLGSSDDPSSPHHSDETQRFVARDPDVTFKHNPFTDQEVTVDYLESVTELPADLP